MDVRQNERHLLRNTNFLWKYLTYRELYRDLKCNIDDSSKMEPQFHSTLSLALPAQQQQAPTSSKPIEMKPNGDGKDRYVIIEY